MSDACDHPRCIGGMIDLLDLTGFGQEVECPNCRRRERGARGADMKIEPEDIEAAESWPMLPRGPKVVRIVSSCWEHTNPGGDLRYFCVVEHEGERYRFGFDAGVYRRISDLAIDRGIDTAGLAELEFKVDMGRRGRNRLLWVPS